MNVEKVIELIEKRIPEDRDMREYDLLLFSNFSKLKEEVLSYYDVILDKLDSIDDVEYGTLGLICMYYENKGVNGACNLINDYCSLEYDEDVNNNQLYIEVLKEVKSIFLSFISNIKEDNALNICQDQLRDVLTKITAMRTKMENIFESSNNFMLFINSKREMIISSKNASKVEKFLIDVNFMAMFLKDVIQDDIEVSDVEYRILLEMSKTLGLQNFGTIRLEFVEELFKAKNNKQEVLSYQLSFKEFRKKIFDLIDMVAYDEEQKKYYWTFVQNNIAKYLNYDPNHNVGNYLVDNVLNLYFCLVCSNDVISILNNSYRIDYSKINMQFVNSFNKIRQKLLNYGYMEEDLNNICQSYQREFNSFGGRK